MPAARKNNPGPEFLNNLFKHAAAKRERVGTNRAGGLFEPFDVGTDQPVGLRRMFARCEMAPGRAVRR
jgi:hypothetical protein